MKMKIKGFNMTRKLIPPIPKKDLIKNWKIFPGDTVLITQGKEQGKSGKVLQLYKPLNSVYVQGCNMVYSIAFILESKTFKTKS